MDDCSTNCNGNGECISGHCHCFPGFLGPDCARGNVVLFPDWLGEEMSFENSELVAVAEGRGGQ